MNKRLKQIEPYLPLKVSQFNSPIDYLKSKNDQLQEFVKNEWLNVDDANKKQETGPSL